jgi:hypothetical protein
MDDYNGKHRLFGSNSKIGHHPDKNSNLNYSLKIGISEFVKRHLRNL